MFSNVEDLTARRVEDLSAIGSVLDEGIIPVIVDAVADVVREIRPF